MRLGILIVCWFLLLTTPTNGQEVPQYDLAGASKPKPDFSFRKENQYKRVHQSALRKILRGETDSTESFLKQYLGKFPEDAESWYMLGILHGRLGNLETAEQHLQRAINAGLPDGRLMAGPRQIMSPMHDTGLLKKLRNKYQHRLVHGPMIGNVTGSSASFWVRTAMECEVTACVWKDDQRLEGDPVQTRASEDFTAVAVINGLHPNTEYRYEIWIDGNKPDQALEKTFRTLSAKGSPSKFAVAFGGGAGYVPENERMWDTIGRLDPHALLLLGDNVYIDDPESIVMQQYTYQRRQSRPEWRRLTARTPVFTIWDDHDFSTNDSWGGPDIDKPFWKKDFVFPIFRQNWANPGYGGGEPLPGCWYAFSIGDVDFIMLDCRYYRTNPRQSPKSMLGATQKQWLKDQLTSATGTFKVICSSVPWDFRTKGDSFDTWNGYKEEHEEILTFIESNQIEGVVLMSADRHRSDAWKISRPQGYDLYEFNSSRLTNQHIHQTMEQAGAIFSYNRTQSFGLVTFDTTLSDPSVTYEVVNIEGEKPHAITVKRSELNHNSKFQPESSQQK